ncbi:MAG: sodium:solute symporter family transporter [Bacillota bacterium]
MVSLGVFLVVMVAIGIWGMRQTQSLGNFFLGGRNIGPWMSAFAYGTTCFSAVIFIGVTGKLGWGFGLPCLWVAVGNSLIGALLSWIVLGRRTRIMTQNLQTMTEFFQERYGARFLKLFTALIIFVFLVPYSASVFTGLAYLFKVNFNISYDLALILMIAITGVYLVLGGYFAVAMTEPGVYAGIITGMTLAIVLFYKLGPDKSPMAATIAMLVPFVVVPIVSLMTTPPSDEILDRAFAGISADKTPVEPVGAEA